MKLLENPDAYTVAKIWISFVLLVLGTFIITRASGYLEFDTLGIWILSCVVILYLSRGKTGVYSGTWKWIITLIGVLMCLLSFFSIQLGITNPPYSIGELTLLLSGLGVIVFSRLNFRSLVFPVSIPFIAVIGFWGYEFFIRNQEWLMAPLVPFIVTITIGLLHIFGIEAVAHGNMISFVSLTGDQIYLSIVSDCTGILSLGTFTVAVIIVLTNFPRKITGKSLLLIAIGYIGTFCTNAARILLIALSGYFFGPVGVIEKVHVHIGWICFSIWMIIFWYYYFTRQLGITIFKARHKTGETP